MKQKLFWGALAFCLLYGLGLAQSIQVVSPAEGATWRKNLSHTITWTKSGEQKNTVKIRLFNVAGTEVVKPIVDSTPNNGSYVVPAGFFNDVPSGDYKIRVRTTDNAVSGFSGVFHLASALNMQESPLKPELKKKRPQFSEKKPDFHKKIPELVLNSITVISPAKNAHLKEGQKATIQFESNMNPPFHFELVKGGSKEKIMDCAVGSVNKQGGTNVFKTDWTIPQYDYNALLGVKIRVSNGNVEGLSESFYIQNEMQKKVIEIPVTQTVNKLKRHWHKYDKNAFSITPPGEDPDPGPGKLRVGYSHYKDDEQYEDYAYRSWVYFDLKSLQGKGLVLKASLVYSQYAGCNTFVPNIHMLTSQWNGDPGALFSIPSSPVSPTNLSPNLIIDWIAHPDNNYGFVFIGPNENMSAVENKRCVANYDNVKLVLEVLSK